MTGRESSRVNRNYKTKYRVSNWPEYERGLRDRGDVTIWLSEEAIAAWNAPKSGLPGGQRRYSDIAIATALTLRLVFHLPLRQTEGFLGSLLQLMNLNLEAPDHTTEQERRGAWTGSSPRRSGPPDRRLDRAQDLRRRCVEYPQTPQIERAARLAKAARGRGR